MARDGVRYSRRAARNGVCDASASDQFCTPQGDRNLAERPADERQPDLFGDGAQKTRPPARELRRQAGGAAARVESHPSNESAYAAHTLVLRAAPRGWDP